jgi:hypothetical protein
VLATGLPASAAPALTASGVNATVSGTTVSVTANVRSSEPVTADLLGICVRDAAGRDRDFPLLQEVSLDSQPELVVRSGEFAAGTYSYTPCVNLGGAWFGIGAARSFTVTGASAQPAAEPAELPAAQPDSGGSSGAAMPTGNLSGWKLALSEDFTTPVARGSFPGPYDDEWMSYDGFPDTSQVGWYDDDIISVQDGNLDLYLHTENGTPLGAAPIPLVDGNWGGQSYGRFSVRMKADPIHGFGTGFLLWTDSGDWNDGEIDFPESELTDVAKGYNHCPGNPSVNCLVVNTSARYSDWHTYTIEWRPNDLKYLVDGVVVGSTSRNVPSEPLHWVMQAATTGERPDPSASGHLLIDWVTIHTMA